MLIFVRSATLSHQMKTNNSGLSMSYSDSYNRIAAQKRLKDYDMLAFACKRAGKSRDEGRAYYSTGVLYDNKTKKPKIIAVLILIKIQGNLPE